MKSMTSSDKLFISLVLLAYTGNNGSNNLTRISSTGMKQTSPLPHFEWKWAHADVKTPEHPDGRHPLLWPLLTVSYGHTWLQASLHSQCFLELSLKGSFSISSVSSGKGLIFLASIPVLSSFSSLCCLECVCVFPCRLNVTGLKH